MGLIRLVRGRVTLYNSITWWEGDDTLIPSIPEPSVSLLTGESVFWPRLIDRDGRISQDYRVTISQFLQTNHSHGGRTSNILVLDRYMWDCERKIIVFQSKSAFELKFRLIEKKSTLILQICKLGSKFKGTWIKCFSECFDFQSVNLNIHMSLNWWYLYLL